MFMWVAEVKAHRLCFDSYGSDKEIAVSLLDLKWPIRAEAHVRDFLLWRYEHDQDYVLDHYDLALGFFGGRGLEAPWDLASLLRYYYEHRE